MVLRNCIFSLLPRAPLLDVSTHQNNGKIADIRCLPWIKVKQGYVTWLRIRLGRFTFRVSKELSRKFLSKSYSRSTSRNGKNSDICVLYEKAWCFSGESHQVRNKKHFKCFDLSWIVFSCYTCHISFNPFVCPHLLFKLTPFWRSR